MIKLFIALLAGLSIANPLWGALRVDAHPQSLTSSFLATCKQITPHTPPIIALALMGSTHLPLKQHYRISTATMQNIQWGCFTASIIVIAYYLFCIHKKLKRFDRYMELNDAGIVSDQRQSAILRAMTAEEIALLAQKLPSAERADFKRELTSAHGRFADLRAAYQEHLASNDKVSVQ